MATISKTRRAYPSYLTKLIPALLIVAVILWVVVLGPEDDTFVVDPANSLVALSESINVAKIASTPDTMDPASGGGSGRKVMHRHHGTRCAHHHHHNHEGHHVAFSDHVKTAGRLLFAANRTCPCCGWTGSHFDFQYGGKGRADARCPHCGALESNRQACAFVGSHPELLDVTIQELEEEHQHSNAMRLLHVSPNKQAAMALDRSTFKLDQIWMDFNQGQYNGMTAEKVTKTLHADLEAIQYPDNFAHAIMLLHVLHRVVDLDLAMEEISRILKPNGWLLIDVPMMDFKVKQTIQCSDLDTRAERVKCGGSKNHHWSFAKEDFEATLAEYFECEEAAPMILDRAGKQAYDAFQMLSDDRLLPQYFCRKPKPLQHLKVVYAGFPRHGTHSLSIALKYLGYKPCHGRDIRAMVMDNIDNAALPNAFVNGDVDTIVRKTEEMGYDATLEIHGLYWRDIMKKRPDAKYIFAPVRPVDKWSLSMEKVDRLTAILNCFPFTWLPKVRLLAEMIDSLTAVALQVSKEEAHRLNLRPFSSKNKDEIYEARLAAKERYEQDMEAAVKANPENTLVFDIQSGDGFPELCKFLGITEDMNRRCSAEEFPRKKTKDDREVAILQGLRLAAWLGVALAVYVIVRFVYSKRNGTLASSSSSNFNKNAKIPLKAKKESRFIPDVLSNSKQFRKAFSKDGLRTSSSLPWSFKNHRR